MLRSGEGRIRTDGAIADTLVFKTRAINHSTTSPFGQSVGSTFISYSLVNVGKQDLEVIFLDRCSRGIHAKQASLSVSLLHKVGSDLIL